MFDSCKQTSGARVRERFRGGLRYIIAGAGNRIENDKAVFDVGNKYDQHFSFLYCFWSLQYYSL